MSGAFVDEPIPDSPHRYRVTGAQPVHGHKRGDEFEALLDKRQEARLIAAGALEKLGETPNQLASLSRDDLDNRALELGIEEPQKLKNKPAVIAAIEAAQDAGETPAQDPDASASPNATEGAE